MRTSITKIGGSIYLLIPKGIVEKYKLDGLNSFEVHESEWDQLFDRR